MKQHEPRRIAAPAPRPAELREPPRWQPGDLFYVPPFIDHDVRIDTFDGPPTKRRRRGTLKKS